MFCEPRAEEERGTVWVRGRYSVNLSLRFMEHEGFLCSLEWSSLQLAVESKESQLN